jgi:hypothetical protein
MCTHTLPHALQYRTLPPSQGGLRAATCPVALDHASLQGRAPVHHVSYNSRSCLPTREGFGALQVLQLQILHPCKGGLWCATCHTALDLASLQGRAPVLLQLRILPPYRGGLRCATCVVAPDPLGGLWSATCPMALNLVSLSGGLQYHHCMPCDFLWIVDLKHKEKPSRPACAARLACFQHTRAYF